MRMKHLVGAVALAAVATPAVAAEFYVVQDASTKRCSIVEQRPTATTTTVIGNGVYTTRTEAESALKTVQVCSTSGPNTGVTTGVTTGGSTTTTTTTTPR